MYCLYMFFEDLEIKCVDIGNILIINVWYKLYNLREYI